MSIFKSEKILSAVLKGSAINLLARVINYLRYVVIAVLIGFNAQTDAFFLAMGMLGLLLVFSSALETLGVPQLTQARMDNNWTQFRQVAAKVLGLVIVVEVLAIVIFTGAYPLFVKAAVGFDGAHLQYYQNYLVYLFPFVLMNIMFQFFGGILRSLRLFTLYFIGELLVAVLTLGLLYLLLSQSHSYALPLAFNLGIAGGVLLLGAFVVNKISFKPDFSGIREYGKYWFMLAIMAGIFSLNGLVDKVFGSLLENKSVTALTYGLLLASALFNVVRPQNYYITYLSEGHTRYQDVVRIGAKVFLVGLIGAVILAFLMPWVVDLLFGYGKFGALDHGLVTLSAQLYLLSLPFMMIWPAVYQVFQIRRKLLWVMWAGFGGVLTNLGLNYWLVVIEQMGIKGITLGTFGAYLVMVVVGLLLLRKLDFSPHSQRS